MVSNIINKISEMFLSGYQHLHLHIKETKEISFVEENDNTKNPEVKYTASNHLLSLKLDTNIDEKNKRGKNIKIANGDMFLFFEDISGLKKICDYIVFYKFEEKLQHPEKQEHLFCFLINLKSEESGTSGQQITAAKIFSEFVLAHAQQLLDIEQKFYFIKALHKATSSTLNKTGKKVSKSKANKDYDYSKVLLINRKEDFDNLCRGYFRQFQTNDF